MRRSRPALISVVLALLLSTTTPAATAATGSTGGFNDWNCRPDPAHPTPVVLVHGTGDNMETTWRALGPRLVDQGYCAFALTYGVIPDAPVVEDVVGGLMPIDYSARELGEFIDQVLNATGSPKVDIVGYSQGTMVPTYFAKVLGGGPLIDKYVSLAPGWDGTNLAGLGSLHALLQSVGLGGLLGLLTDCRACLELLAGSETLRMLNEGGIFLPEITYTNIITKYDEIVVPYTSGIGHGPNVTNIILQDTCPADRVNHVGLVVDPNALGHVLGALDPANAAPVPCVPMRPVKPAL
ncbi:esterase/lipase family protein [Amycolatopsis palatopharyngis]|uniref:esterase/lipase family protein n=1 Tax=Amycolatopsis palatopharyngis TaxID=187982 RepID=UPI000E280AE8|nr:alpha/beta fold hydrolase [Amycolatopsis palatopharyngis]